MHGPAYVPLPESGVVEAEIRRMPPGHDTHLLDGRRAERVPRHVEAHQVLYARQCRERLSDAAGISAIERDAASAAGLSAPT